MYAISFFCSRDRRSTKAGIAGTAFPSANSARPWRTPATVSDVSGLQGLAFADFETSHGANQESYNSGNDKFLRGERMRF
jgi:hypothetical protein